MVCGVTPVDLLPGINTKECCTDACTHICGYGGCEDMTGMEQVGKAEPCVNATAHCFYTCMRETCCPSQCCTKLNCTQLPGECQVPQQKYLDPGDTDKSEIYYAGLSDSSIMPFPFFASLTVPPGSSCEAARAWGRCRCTDGVLEPGCDPLDSSTWLTLNGTGRLPANLSLTCTIASPQPGGGGGGGGSAAGSDSSQGQHRRRHHGLSPGALAGIIVGSTVGGLVLLGLAGYGGYLGIHTKKWMQSRVGASYQPVFTGQSYTPETEYRAAGGLWSRITGLFSRRQPQYSSHHSSRGPGSWGLGALAAGGGMGYQQAGEAGQSWLAGVSEEVYGLDAPAVPEEDLFTLEDLEEGDRRPLNPRGGRHYSPYRQHHSRQHAHGRELELGSVRDRQHKYPSPQHTPGKKHGHSRKEGNRHHDRKGAGPSDSASRPLLSQEFGPGRQHTGQSASSGPTGGAGADITTYSVALGPGEDHHLATPTHTGGKPVRPRSSQE